MFVTGVGVAMFVPGVSFCILTRARTSWGRAASLSLICWFGIVWISIAQYESCLLVEYLVLCDDLTEIAEVISHS